MLKKLIVWSLYSAFIGVLIAGAVNRTSAKLGNTEPERNGHGLSVSENTGEISVANVHESEHTRERLTLDGQATSVTTKELSIRLLDGQIVTISRRAWRYTQGYGFTAQAGDPLRVEGFFENATFEVTRITNLRNGQIVSLRDDKGHPLWSGNQ